ncbi:hypothetical protein PoB_006927700 [Plakobranchus ocellatus]|uniref:Uncharacterized protein n=1 Tax=Plakobranchus ocellatus TaxID=259542 RepID=A0AAV4DFI8_9GAST|nr:hypothetical protein PoB_006927700 [Plakobranchus ocellatus]
MVMMMSLLYIVSPQQGDLRLSGPLPGQGACGRARTRDRRIPADLQHSDDDGDNHDDDDDGHTVKMSRDLQFFY